MATMSFSVSKSPPELVAPSEETPSGSLPLSAMDQMMPARIMIDVLLVFGNGGGQQEATAPAMVMKDALAKVLVHYYPVAGSLTEEPTAASSTEGGGMAVACTGEGVWFMEASANCDLEDVNSLERPLMIPKEELIPSAPPHVNKEYLTFLMQVTSFKCGGFAVGVKFSHIIFDGLGVAQFLKAHGEMAMGLHRPSIEPVWARDAIPSPAKPSQGHPLSSFPDFKFETSVFDVPDDHINKIKNEFVRETGQRCSTFDVVTALLWKCRTRAVGLEPRARVHLGFAANSRHLLRQVLPEEGFYGNCVFHVGVDASSEAVAGAPLVEAVIRIRDAKERMPGKFAAWMTGELENGEDPYAMAPLEYGTLIVSDWSRVGFSEVNYGRGLPMHVVPLNDDHNFLASCIYVRTNAPRQGIRLMARCVESKHLAAFRHEMKQQLHPNLDDLVSSEVLFA